MKSTIVDRFLIALNFALVAAVVVFLVKPGGMLRNSVDRLWVERRAKRLLSEDWQRIISGTPTMAGDSANIEVVLFSDYECPFCRATYPSLISISSRPLGAGIALRHLASSAHPNAHRAAAAAICAGEQRRFSAMNALLFTARLDSLGLDWGDAASASGVSDVTTFLRCMSDPSIAARISADSALAAELGIRATPTF
ncbi:MAG TPA: thioredoxin domain-containing protein, partial [Terrimicrobiaceae bacterium]|nr:thioredoxin domain-containing protein [Terrimicrobiaceae bacterium]